MKKGYFCSRKGGVTVGGVFHPMKRTSLILADQLERKTNKLRSRRS